MKKRILTILMMMVLMVPSEAVLNESDFVKTLSVLKEELDMLLKKQMVNIENYRQYNQMQHEKMLDFIQRSNQTALILYSQKQDHIFNLTYACNEATQLYREYYAQEPYFKMIQKVDAEIDRYDRLIEALMSLPPKMDGVDSLRAEIAYREQLELESQEKDTASVIDNGIIKLNLFRNDFYRMPLRPQMVDVHKVEVDSASADNIAAMIERDSTNAALMDSLMTSEGAIFGQKSFSLTPMLQARRDSCVDIAFNIRESLLEIHDSMQEDAEQYIALGENLRRLNDYAEKKYEYIKGNIFKNGEENFVVMVSNLPYYLGKAINDIKEKYIPTGEVKSDWRGPVVVMFAFVVVLYLFVVVVICNIIIRFVVPSRLKGEKFEMRKNYIIIACSMVLFSIVLYVIGKLVDDNFFKMACGLLVEFTLLMSAIVASILFRLKPDRLRYGYRLYLPIMAMGFFVILIRIIFMPNSVVSLIFPPVLLIATIFQYTGVRHYSKKVESVDKFYTWISFATIAVSCVASWLGFTLLAVQIFMWWMMQLTCVHAITCCKDAMKIYEDKILLESIRDTYETEAEQAKVMKAYHAKNGEYYKLTWLGDLVNITIIPMLSVLSLPLCLYWASDIFDMSDTWQSLFMTDFIEIKDMFELSLFKIVTVGGLYFVFKFISYTLKSAYHYHVRKTSGDNAMANITLGNNIIAIVVWGIFFIIALVLMNVPSTGISIVSAGLATGVGFALKDILNNFFYGISLMAGRVKVGEIIECDGIRGTVHSITYQSTQIQTLDGSIMAFLNSNLFAKSFKNLTRNHDYEFIKMPIGVAYGTNVQHVRELLLERLNEYLAKQNKRRPDIDPEKGVSVMFSGFGDSSVDLSVVFWVRITTKLKTTSEVNEIIYDTLNENNIEIPFPQRDVHMR